MKTIIEELEKKGVKIDDFINEIVSDYIFYMNTTGHKEKTWQEYIKKELLSE